MRAGADRKPLDPLLVLELTEGQAGATCTQVLAWLGARVIKVEPPQGEPGRRVGEGVDPQVGGVFFFLHNTNKQSITLNLHHPRGPALLTQLVAKADVVVDNLKPGTLERLGLPYARLREANPTLIYATLSGFGSDGPYRAFPCTEAVAEALGGGLGTTGFPHRPPTLPRSDAGESGAGLHAALAILAAVADCLDTGRGHQVEVTMQEAVVNLVRTRLWPTYITGKPYPRQGNDLLTVPGGTYPCKPGGPNDYVYVFVHPDVPAMWHGCLRAMGREDLIGDPRYEEARARMARREEVEKLFTDWSLTLDKRQVMEALGRHGVPCGAVLDSAELLDDPHLQARGFFVPLAHPHYGRLSVPGCPIRLDDTPAALTPPPRLGADNAAVYGELLGLTPAQLEQLRHEGVI
ncbi:MAG: formyl-CoA:oxalate CoA-transferase [Candidatus Tectimicrobiota bacterium]|nr:MAG: formyl-CoA:oxalate CoA-transferase [Candidatus Tectomicrobia bacterium]